MRSLLLLLPIVGALLAGCSSEASCEDACVRLVDDCGWFDRKLDEGFATCVDLCREVELGEETRACLAETRCRWDEQRSCFADRSERRSFEEAH
jgi:hypothetical protein